MATYVVLINWTDQGVKHARDTVQRAQAFRSDMERLGGKVTGLYWTQGRYDLIATLEVPDELTAMAGALAVSGLGNVHTETLRAFNDVDMTSILQRL